MGRLHKIVIVGLGAVVCVGGLSLAQRAKAAVTLTADAVIPYGVTFNGEDVSGQTAEEITAYIENYVQKELNKTLTVQTEVEGEPLQFAAADYNVQWTNTNVTEEIISTIPSGSIVEKYKKIKDIAANPVDYSAEFSADTELLTSTAYEYMLAHTTSPQEPSLTKNGNTFSSTAGQNGIGFNVEVSNENLINGMLDPTVTETELYYVETQPQYDANIFDSFQGNILGNYCTDYSGGKEERDQNVERASTLINGTVLMPGEEFSFLTKIGVVSVETGFSSAPVIQSGVYVDEIGGGLCQVSSTLYNAVLLAELNVTFRQQHSKVSTYVPYSFDAMVYPGSDNSSDFRFQNSTENPIYIESYCADEKIYFTIYGNEYRDANRTVAYTQEVVDWRFEISKNNPVDTAADAYEIRRDSTLKNGDPFYVGDWAAKVRIELAPHPWVHSRMYKEVYVDGNLVERTLVNDDTYGSTAGIIYMANDTSLVSVGAGLVATSGTSFTPGQTASFDMNKGVVTFYDYQYTWDGKAAADAKDAEERAKQQKAQEERLKAQQEAQEAETQSQQETQPQTQEAAQ